MPGAWTVTMTAELLELLWLLEATLEMQPELDALLDEVVGLGGLSGDGGEALGARVGEQV